MPRLTPALTGFAFLVSSFFVAGSASATNADFSYKVCLMKSWTREEGEDKVKEKDKFKKVGVLGTNLAQLEYELTDAFSVTFATEVKNDRKRKVVPDMIFDPQSLLGLQTEYGFEGNFTINSHSLTGKRKVTSNFQRSKDSWDLRANITYDDGDLSGLTFDVRYQYTCKDGKRK